MTSEQKQRIFIFEPLAKSRERCVKACSSLGLEMVVTSSTSDATAALEGDVPQALLIANTPGGIELGQYIREFTTIDAPLAAMVDPLEDNPKVVVDAMGADAYLLRPVSASALDVFLQLAPRMTLAAVPDLSGSGPPEALKSVGSPVLDLPKTRTGFHHFEDVKDLLVVEVRRAKRYGYPLSVLLVRLDPIPAFQQLQRPGLPREITGGLASAIARAVRVIDLPIHYADDSIMVFLPHTDQEGAEEVGRRIKRRIKRITYRDDQIRCQLTASVGVAGISAGDNLTFSKLIRNATAALRAAQLKGGDKVMKKVSSHRLPTGRTGPFLPAAHGLRVRLDGTAAEGGLVAVDSDAGMQAADTVRIEAAAQAALADRSEPDDTGHAGGDAGHAGGDAGHSDGDAMSKDGTDSN